MKKLFSVFLLLALTLLLASCGKKTDAPTTNNITTTKKNDTTAVVTTTQKRVDSEVAINNFLDKLFEFNYSIEAEDFLKISIFSEDLIYFDFVDYYDEVYATVNTDETFRCVIKGENKISFFNEGTAAEVLFTYLPNYWESYANYNIWNILTNSVENPLEFTFANDAYIKEIVGSTYLGIGQTAIAGIKEMMLYLNDENPTSATISVKYVDNGQLSPKEETRTLTITFGIEKTETLPVDEWINNPNREYPQAKTAWDEEDEACFSVAFNQGYDVDALMPFPTFATYSFILDSESLYYNGILEFRDKNATLSDAQAYANSLSTTYGFIKETETDMYGNTKEAYHKQIDDFGNGYYAYSSIYVEYDEGVNITTRKYYNHKDYEGLDSLNTLVTEKNFPTFDSSTDIISINTTDFTYEYIEGWANLFTYDLVIDVLVEFKDEADINSYIMAYINKLTTNNFVYNEATSSAAYESEAYKNTLRFMIDNQSCTLWMQIKSEKFITDDEISSMLVASRFPAMDLSEIDSICKNITPLYRILYGQTHNNVYLISLTFETLEERNAFLDDYIDDKCNKAGFEFVSPNYARVPHKTLAYYNATEKLILCFNYPEDSLQVSLHLIECAPTFEPFEEEVQ